MESHEPPQLLLPLRFWTLDNVTGVISIPRNPIGPRPCVDGALLHGLSRLLYC